MSGLHLPSASAVLDIQTQLNGGNPYRESCPRDQSFNNAVPIAAAGVMYHVAIVCLAGDVITNITMRSGGTAAVGPTNWWFALYSSAATPALLSQTADQLTTPITQQTNFTIALAAPQTIPTTGVYYGCVMVAASGAIPTFNGKTSLSNGTMSNGILTGQKRLAGFSGSGLTGTAPGTIASPTTTSSIPYVALS